MRYSMNPVEKKEMTSKERECLEEMVTDKYNVYVHNMNDEELMFEANNNP